MNAFNEHFLIPIEKRPEQRNAVQNFLFNRDARRLRKEVNLLEHRSHHGVKSKVDLLRCRLKTEVVQACMGFTTCIDVQTKAEYDMMHITLAHRFKEDTGSFFQLTIACPCIEVIGPFQANIIASTLAHATNQANECFTSPQLIACCVRPTLT